MQNTEQNIKVYSVLMLVKESMEMSGWNDRLSEMTADVHRSLEKAEDLGKEEGEGIETLSKEETEQPEDEMDGFSKG